MRKLYSGKKGSLQVCLIGGCWHDRKAGGRLTGSKESHVIGLVCILCILDVAYVTFSSWS